MTLRNIFRRQPLADNRRPGWHLDTNAFKAKWERAGKIMVRAHIREATPR